MLFTLLNLEWGYLATFSCFFFWIIGYMKSRKVRRVLIPVAFVVLIVAFLVKSAGYHHDESSMGRVDAWSVGMTMFKEHPLIGVGKYQFFEHHKIDSRSSFTFSVPGPKLDCSVS